MDGKTLRAVALGVAVVLIYASRMTKGSVKQTAEGMEFGLKPMFAVVRGIALPAYVLFFAYMTMAQHRAVPWWMWLLFVAAVVLGVAMMPGTILLGPGAVTQRFWFLPTKTIGYGEVMALQAMQGGRMVRVMGDNRVSITHSSNHSAADVFKVEMERRTGKRVV